MTGPQAHMLGNRLHLNHGPIDLIVEAWGTAPAVRAAYASATARFDTLLSELCEELPALRRPLPHDFHGPTARRMAAACAPHRGFVTPMAAVAGAVADTVLSALVSPEIPRAYVNNGGDIALHLTRGQTLTAAMGLSADRITLHHTQPVRGVATSGWRGRSQSLGIADAVTVLARSAAAADVAATLIANAVDLPGHPAIIRTPAMDLMPDSDLGHRPVTTHVGALTQSETAQALSSGAAVARRMRDQGLIEAAALFLDTQSVQLTKDPAHA